MIADTRIRFSGAVTHSPRAARWICVAFTPSAAGKSKVIEGLHLREAGLAEALANDGLLPGTELGTQDLLQVVLARPVRIARLPGEPFNGPGDARQLERNA